MRTNLYEGEDGCKCLAHALMFLVHHLWDPHGYPPQLWGDSARAAFCRDRRWAPAEAPCRRVISGGVEVEVLRKGSVLQNDKSNVLKKRKQHDLN